MKRRDLLKKLEAVGYKPLREGEHECYYNPDAEIKMIAIPRHREINELTARKILKDAGLK